MEVTCLKREKKFKGQITGKGVLYVFNKYLTKSSTLLDLGAGDGALLQEIKNKYDNIQTIGIDMEPKSDCVIKGDIYKLPFEDDKFDCITCTDVIEHLHDATLNAALSEIFRVLKVGGYVLITTLLEEDLTERSCLCPCCGHVFHRVGHIQTFSENELKERFISVGFKIKYENITHFGLYSYYPTITSIATWVATKLNLPYKIKKFLQKDIIIILEKN